MSYCRWHEGDVYLYASVKGYVCCCCALGRSPAERDVSERKDVLLASPRIALEHLHTHRNGGQKVPERAFNRLQEDVTTKKEKNAHERRAKRPKRHARN